MSPAWTLEAYRPRVVPFPGEGVVGRSPSPGPGKGVPQTRLGVPPPPPAVDWQTENITFPYTSYADGNNVTSWLGDRSFKRILELFTQNEKFPFIQCEIGLMQKKQKKQKKKMHPFAFIK